MRAHTELYGEHVRLRDFRPEDIHDVFAYASDPVVTQYAGWRPHRSLHDSSLYIERCLAETWRPVTFAVEHLREQRVIGVVDIRSVSRLWAIGEIGYTLARTHWGRGFNVEAGSLVLAYGFDRLGFRRIRAVCDIDNRRSYRTMEKLGMAREGLITAACAHSGRPVDRFVYSLMRREWERRGPVRGVIPARNAAAGGLQGWRCGNTSSPGTLGTQDGAAGTRSLQGP